MARNYQNQYVSVTEALGILRKIGLEMWFKANTAEFCNAESKKGKAVGEEIHNAIQQYIETGATEFDSAYPEEVGTALKSFAEFKKSRPDLDLKMAEAELTNEKFKFNGTIDCPCPPVLIDWKTGTAKEKAKPPIYDEYKYQVAAYVVLWNGNHPEALIDRTLIVAIAKDKVAYNTYEMGQQEIDDCFNKVFLPCLSIATYKKWLKNAPSYYQKG